MSPLLAFLIIFVLLLIALTKFKVTPSVGLFTAAILFGLMVGIPAAEVLRILPAGFGSMMTSIGLLIVFGSIFGDFLGESGATEELAKGMVRLFGKKNDLLNRHRHRHRGGASAGAGRFLQGGPDRH